MVTSSTLKTLKKQDGYSHPSEKSAPARSNGLTDRMLSWWRSIWRRRWLSIVTAWLICIAGWSVIALWPTSYITSAVIYADLAELVDENEAAEPTGQAPAAMLKSILLSDEAINDVQETILPDPAEGQSLRDDIMLRSTAPPVFVLTYEHKDPGIAQRVLEALIANYQSRLEQALETSAEAVEVLDEQISDHERSLQTADIDLITFENANADYLQSAGDRQAELALLQEELSGLNDQLKATIAERKKIVADLAKARDEEADVTEIDAPRSLEELRAERDTFEAELTTLRERYADSHPYVVAVLDALEAVDTELLTLTRPETGDASADEGAPLDPDELEQRHGELIVELSSLNSSLEDKRQKIEQLEALTRTTTSVEAELSEREAGIEELRTALSDLQQSRFELEGDSGGEATQRAFRLIKQPELPTDPVGPSRLLALAAVLFGGTGLGAAVAVFCNRLKGVFESAWQLKKRFDVGVLGTISEVMTPSERKQLGYSRLTFGLACLALLGAFSGLAVAEWTDRLAPLGEQLRTQILG